MKEARILVSGSVTFQQLEDPHGYCRTEFHNFAVDGAVTEEGFVTLLMKVPAAQGAAAPEGKQL